MCHPVQSLYADPAPSRGPFVHTMSPIYQNLTLPPQAPSLNTTFAPPPATIPNLSPFAPILQILIFFIGTCIVPTMTAHTPIPHALETALGQTVMMILSPISSAIGAF